MNAPNSPADLIRPQTLEDAANRFATLQNRALEVLSEAINDPVWDEISNLLSLYHTPPLGLVIQTEVENLGILLQEKLQSTLGHMAMHYAMDDWDIHDHGGALSDDPEGQSDDA